MYSAIKTASLSAIFLMGCAVESEPSASQEASEITAAPVPGVVYNILNQFRSGGDRGIPCLAGRTNDRVQMAACTDSFTDQFWQLVPAPASGFFRLVVQIDGRCMAFPSGSNGSETRMSSCVDSFDDQWWRFDPTLDANRFLIRNFRTGKCLVLTERNFPTTTESDCSISFQDQWWTFFQRS